MVGCTSPLKWSETLGDWSAAGGGESAGRKRGHRVLAFDCGAKRNILRNLAERGCEVQVIPHSMGAAEVRKEFVDGRADGLFVSNGPGDPAAVDSMVATLRDLANADHNTNIPILVFVLVTNSSRSQSGPRRTSSSLAIVGPTSRC
jgi:carbamoyl-phosphate synthase small subunit